MRTATRWRRSAAGRRAALRRSIRKIGHRPRYGGEVLRRAAARGKAGSPGGRGKAAARRGGRFDARRGPARAVVGHHLLGVATLGIDAETWESLIEKADSALYEAKRLGRDRVAMAVPLQRASA